MQGKAASILCSLWNREDSENVPIWYMKNSDSVIFECGELLLVWSDVSICTLYENYIMYD